MAREISNHDDVIDSRDVIARIEELKELEEPDEEEKAELATLEALAEEASGYAADWTYGETLIRESYFEEYAMELADYMGSVPKDYPWPVRHIDWKAAADELKQDYTAVDFGGVEYLIR